MTNDIPWREFQVHEDAEQEDKEIVFNMFEEEDPFEMLEFQFPNLPKLVLRGHSDYPNATGLALWRGSEILCEYLVEHRELLQGKRVLELGAGIGLCGLAAHRLGALQVLLTDGDMDVLKNLRSNVEMNAIKKTEDASSVLCEQLIWGQNIDEFAEAHGKQNVILGSDVIYMTKSLGPLWATIDKLLEPDGLFFLANHCASQDPIEITLKVAEENGFRWKSIDPSDKGILMFFRNERIKYEE